MKFKEGDHVEVINLDNPYYRKHGQIIYVFQMLGPNPNKIAYQVEFADSINIFEEHELQLLEEITNNEDSKISRVEQTHNNINEFLKKTGNRAQPTDASLSLIAQMLIEINESLAIICDKL